MKLLGLGRAGGVLSVSQNSNNEKIWMGPEYNGGWDGVDSSLSFNLGTVPAQAFLNIVKSCIFEIRGPGSSLEYNWNEIRQAAWSDADGYPQTLTPGHSLWIRFGQNGNSDIGDQGRYRLTWTGLSTVPNSLSQSTNYIVSSGPNEVVFDLGEDPVTFFFSGFDETNYPRDMVCVREDYQSLYDEGELWNPQFLQAASGYSLLRMLNVMGTNRSTFTQVSDFPSMSSARYSPWPLEAIADICNRVKTDCWICIPHLFAFPSVADGSVKLDETLELVQYFKDNLDPDLKLHVEYSNEVWNSAFGDSGAVSGQYAEMWRQASAAGWATNNNGFNAHMYYAKVVAKLMKAVKMLYGSEAASRLVTIAATQTASTSVTIGIASSARWKANEPNDWEDITLYVDAMAVAPYIGSGWITTPGEVVALLAEIDAGRTQSEINDYMNSRLRDLSFDQQSKDWIINQAAVIKPTGMKMLGYEGGNHVLHFFSINGVVSADVDKIAPYLGEYLYSSKWWEIEEEVMDVWAANGDGPYMSFNLFYQINKFGAWGLYHTAYEDNFLQLAKESWSANTPPWWFDHRRDLDLM